MILDAVLGDGRCWWLSPAEDKRTFFDARETGLRDEEYPHISFSAGRGKIIRCFPDKLPIGIDKEDSSRFVFLYLVTRRIPIEFRQFLIRHHTLFLNLHTWTVRLLVPRRFRKAVALYKAALREELWTPLDPSVSKALETYFRERRERGGHLAEPGDRFIAREFRRQGMAKIAALYRVWRREGDVVLWRSSSTSLRDDRMHGCSVCEVQDLNARYLQLTTAIDREAWAKKGATRCRQLCDGRRLVDHSKRVDARIAQAYVDVITSVPHGTPSVRRHGQRSAHSAGAPGHGIERTPKHRRLMHDDRERFVGAPIELRTSVPLTARHPQDHALRRERVHQGVTLPWLD